MEKKKKERKKSVVPGARLEGNHPGTMRCPSHLGQHGASSSTGASSLLAQRDKRRAELGIPLRFLRPLCSLIKGTEVIQPEGKAE